MTARIRDTTSGGRTRLPTCVVSTRSTLSNIALPSSPARAPSQGALHMWPRSRIRSTLRPVEKHCSACALWDVLSDGELTHNELPAPWETPLHEVRKFE